MTSELRVYHAFRSPYSRLGLHMLKRASLNPEIIPFTGPPKGVAFNDPMQNKPKLRYYSLDAPRMTMRMGLPIAPPKPFDVDFEPANRRLAFANENGRGLDFAIAVSDARWGRGENISQTDVLEAAAEAAGLDGKLTRQALDDPALDEKLAAYQDLVEEDQVFGVPFAVLGPQKYWGHDRFELLLEDLSEE